MQERWAALGLRRAQGAAALLFALLILVYYSSWMTRLLTVFQALIIIRCNLKPNEVHLQPLSRAILKLDNIPFTFSG